MPKLEPCQAGREKVGKSLSKSKDYLPRVFSPLKREAPAGIPLAGKTNQQKKIE
jgi:hypothetical protein